MRKCVVLSGAGISADSGLQTFRDSDGLWEGHRIEEVATPEAFGRNPDMVYAFYNERRRQCNAAEPNAAHRALVDLERYFHVHIITQNIDDLHERAGSKNVLHLHGEINKIRSIVNEDEIIEWRCDQTAEQKDSLGHQMRPFVVWFGEGVPLFSRAIEIVHDADVVVIIGTSLQVYPAASLLQYIRSKAKVYLVDPKPQNKPNVEIIAKRAADGVPELVRRLIGSEHAMPAGWGG